MLQDYRPVLVLGGAGFIGRRVVKQLAGSGQVFAIDLVKPAEVEPGVEWIVGSLADPTLVASAARSCGAAIYLASHSLPAASNSDVAGEIMNHLVSAVKVAEICADQGVEQFVFSSSGGTVYGATNDSPIKEVSPTQPLNAYGVSKLATEHYLRVIEAHRGIRTVSLRVSNPFGPGQRSSRGQGFVAAAMAAAANGTELQIWGDGSVARDFIFVDDVADAFCRAVAYSGPAKVMNIGSGESRSLKEIVEATEAVFGRRIDIKYMPMRSIDAQRNLLDTSLAKSELGWQPTVPFKDGITRTAQSWLM